MNLAESLLHGLKSYGASEIFGIPGDFALPLFKVIEESKILPLYTLSHEPAVGFAADAAARAHARPSVAAVTYGAGALNMVNQSPRRARRSRRSSCCPAGPAPWTAAWACCCITRPSVSARRSRSIARAPATRRFSTTWMPRRT